MKIDDMIERLESIKDDFGDIECLIEVDLDYTSATVPVDELSIEDREGFGVSVKFLM